MINPKELRIGNWIEFGDEFQLTMENFYSCFEHGNSFSEYIFDYRPIPLTEEWLVKFGFTYNDLNGDSGHWQKLPFQILQGEDGFSYDYKLIIKYVNQLQNLYFALTGEELTIK